MSQKNKLQILEVLAAEFPPNEIEWRVQKSGHSSANRPWALIVPYIDVRCVRRRLNEVLGPENWQTRMIPSSHGIVCELSVRINGEWITKTDGADITDFEPFKGGCSQALRRAAVSFGIGEYLYQMPSVFAQIVERGIEGAERIKIDGHDYFWIPPAPVEEAPPVHQRASNPPPVPGRMTVPRAVSAASNAHPQANPAQRIAPRNGDLSSEGPGDIRVPFGSCQGKRIAELSETEIRDLVSFYDRVPRPHGKAKTFRTAFFAYLASNGGAA